ncbi:hypothetical protein [Pseudonocardia sp. KRD291]|uniref:hypothetical protein n=1 Tax=Pseudonocardia sp. KRD291 TaxID=2792007 RepID=UPI001C4A70B8|nr:hypothetical protein [Pseudonocardia sp. KRD291]MBW0102746.1 hypothetical protein [Pseudonocardia sp. KRD291]
MTEYGNGAGTRLIPKTRSYQAAPASTSDTAGPGRAEVDAFVRRSFRCHHCGADGPEFRDTDRAPGSARYRIGSDVVLLPFCPACEPGPDAQTSAVARLVRDVEADTVAWTDPTPLATYRCSDPSCEQVWHDLGAPLPFEPVPDARGGMGWHPCPWCVDEAPTIVTMAHRTRSTASADPAAWGTELHA